MWYITVDYKKDEGIPYTTRGIEAIEPRKDKPGAVWVKVQTLQDAFEFPFTYDDFMKLLADANKNHIALDCRWENMNHLRERLKTLNRPKISGPSCAP